MLLPPGEKRPVVVVSGEGARALVLSVSEEAKRFDIRPGMRVDNLDDSRVLVIPADISRYISVAFDICTTLESVLPEMTTLRAGFFSSTWSLGTDAVRLEEDVALDVFVRAFADTNPAPTPFC